MSVPAGEVRYAATILADVERLWSVVRSFGEVANWSPIVARSRLVAGREGEIGAEREIVTADHKSARERLILLDPIERRLGYEMIVFPIPVTRQENEIRLETNDDAGSTRIMFSARFVPIEGVDPAAIADMNRSAFEQAAAGLARFVSAEIITG